MVACGGLRSYFLTSLGTFSCGLQYGDIHLWIPPSPRCIHFMVIKWLVFELFEIKILHVIWIFRLINPVVVSPTIAAVGLSFYSYGFPLVGTCLEIGAVQILVVIVFSLVSLLNSSSHCLWMDHCTVLTCLIFSFLLSAVSS